MKQVGFHKSFFGLVLIAATMGAVVPRTALAREPVIVDEATTMVNLGLHLDYFEDKEGTLSIDQILAPEVAKKFVASQTATPNRGFTESAYWFWFELENPQTQHIDRLLEIGYPLLDDVHVYFFSQTQEPEHLILGDKLIFSKRPINHRNFVIPLELQAGEMLRVLIRVETKGSLRVPIRLWHPHSFFEQDARNVTVQGLFFGLILVMALYNLFVYFSLRELSYLYYVGFVACIAGTMAALSGLSYQYLWPNSIWWSEKNLVFFIGISEMFACLFANQFLDLSHHAKKHLRLISLLAGLSGLAALGGFFFPYPIMIRAVVILIILEICVCFSAGIIRWRQGSIEARYYTLAWLSFFLGTGTIAFTVFGLLPANILTANSPQIGAALEIVLLSLGLARKLKTLTDTNLQLQKTTAEDLQAKVASATAELREQAQRLKELDKEKNVFFQNMSHELRTPLTLILNPLEEASSRYQGDKSIEVAAKNSRRLMRLVNQLLDFQNLVTEKQELLLTPVNLPRFVIACGEYFSDACSTRGIKFLRTLNGEPLGETPEPVHILGEIDALEKVTFNFLSNALTALINYTPTSGLIELGLTTSPEKVRIFIRDTGPGISSEGKKQLFQYFSQLDETATQSYEGAGLGLALVKSLAEKMKGIVGIETELGEGSTFWAEFPTCETPATEETLNIEGKDWLLRYNVGTELEGNDSETLRRTDIPAGTGELVLIVDDLPDMRNLISLYVKKGNYRVIKASDGKRGLEAAHSHKPDLIITDWMMPHMNGPELIEALKGDEELSSIPVILLTAKSDEESKVLGSKVGADAFLGKPFNADELMSTVRNLMGLKLHQKRAITALTDLQEAQEKLIESEKLSALGVLVAGVAHEINTPLASIQTTCETIESLVHKLEVNDEGWTSRFDKLSVINANSIKQVSKIVQSLRRYARPDAEKPETLAIREMLDSTLAMVHSGLNGVPVKLVCDEKLEFPIFPSKVAQVVNNLLINAAHACEEQENPKINLIAEHENGSLCISIQDNGTGVPEKLKGKIFDPFFTTKAVGKGTGLGLALCKRFAEEMGGSLELSDESPGATFRFTLNEEVEP